jgi:p-aminobenzoyl-glutamate transporter AbgT
MQQIFAMCVDPSRGFRLRNPVPLNMLIRISQIVSQVMYRQVLSSCLSVPRNLYLEMVLLDTERYKPLKPMDSKLRL